MTIFDKEHEPPEPGPGDLGAAVVRSVLGGVPVVGQGLQELFQYVVTPSLDRRLHEWRLDIAAAIRRLEAERAVDPESLKNNPAFIDAVLTATQAAIRTSQRAKLDALRAAVVNSALSTSLDETSQQVFLAWIDRFTELHLQLLKLFHDPRAWRKDGVQRLTDRMHGDAADVLEEALPAFATERGRTLYAAVWADLYAAGLVRLNTLSNQGEGPAIMSKRTTALGDAFVAFITSPLRD